MTRRRAPRTERVASLARASLVLFFVAVACGGKSIRYVEGDDGTGGDGDDPSTGGRGGASNGGSGAVDPLGGTSFTGGTFTGGTSPGGTAGTIAVGGTSFIGGTGGTGGTIAIGGTSFTGGTAGVAGRGGGCAGPRPVTPVINWDFDGTIHYDQNPHAINGGWYTFDDCGDASLAGLPCTVRNPMLFGPDGNRGWAIATSTAVCASGTAPRVQIGPDGTPAYAIQWGFGMGFSLNGGAPFNAAAACIRGFELELTGSAPATLRMNVVTPKTIGVSHFKETQLTSLAFFTFDQLRQGSWVQPQSALDITQITDIHFHVFTNEQTSTPFQFCVENVRPMY